MGNFEELKHKEYTDIRPNTAEAQAEPNADPMVKDPPPNNKLLIIIFNSMQVIIKLTIHIIKNISTKFVNLV